MKSLSDLNVGDGVYFKEGDNLVVRAKGGKYLIATTEVTGAAYTIIDTDKGFCGTNDRTFNPYDYTKQEDIEQCLSDLLEGKYGMGISKRHGANVDDVLDMSLTLS